MSNTPVDKEGDDAPAQAGGGARTPRVKVTDVIQGASAAAGTAAIVYVVGGMVMWLRFRKAGLPPDHAVALMERQQLLVIGLRLMVLPAALTGALAWLVMHRHARRSRRLPPRMRHVLKTAVFLLAATFALLLPFSFASATWVLAALVVVGYLRYERRPADAPIGPAAPSPDEPPAVRRAPKRPAPAWARVARDRRLAASDRLRERTARVIPYVPFRRRTGRQASPLVVTMLVVVVAAVVSLGRQLDQPVQLLDARVSAKDPERTIEGVYISSDSDEVFVGLNSEIKAIPRSTVREVALGPPRQRAPSPSIMSRALGGNRFAITPFEWWCNGERYGWGDAGDLCRTQVQLVKGDGQKVQRRDLAGDAVPITLRCPAAAKKPCRGFLRMASRQRYQFGPAGLPRPVVFRARLRPIGAPDSAEAGIAPGQDKVMCLPVDNGQRGLLRNARPVGDPAPLEGHGKRPIAFDITISGDAEERNLVRSESYVMSVTRPDQPIEYWGECSTLRVSCSGTAGTPRAARITCTIRATRRFTGTATLTISDEQTEFAEGEGTLAGTSLVVRPAVRRTLPRGRYQAVVLLRRGGSARKLWTYFNLR